MELLLYQRSGEDMQEFAEEAQAIGQFLQAHVLFDVALGLVFAMPILSLIFSFFNRPANAAAKLKSTLEDLNENQPDQVKLLWDYALHSDDLFNDRQNFFLFFESILLSGTFAVIAATIAQRNSDILKIGLQIVAFSGLLTTVSWWYLQLRQEYVLNCLTEFHKVLTPVYEKVIFHIRKKPYYIGTNLILVNVLPLLVALLWVAILLYVYLVS